MSDESADVWDAVASGWDEDPIVRAYAAAAFDSLVALLDRDGRSIEGMVVCDFGCGSGLLTERLVAAGAASIDAVDTSVEMLAQLRAKADRLGWTTVHATDEPPAGAAGHDLVVCSSVLGFVPDHSATVAQLAGLLAPGGLFVQWDWETDPDPPDTADPHGLSRSAIETALVAADLVDVEVGVGFKLPFGDVVMRPLIGSGRAPR